MNVVASMKFFFAASPFDMERLFVQVNACSGWFAYIFTLLVYLDFLLCRLQTVF